MGGGVMAGSRLLVGAGYMLKLPAIDLAEVGAGGGSICRLDSAGAPKVGPESAGAEPGPVCYGRGGIAPTITDCNLVLGYLDPGGLTGGTMRLDLEAARAAIQRDLAGPLGMPVEEAAHGMLRLASATMMRAIRAVSVERGRDPQAVRDAGVWRQRSVVRCRHRGRTGDGPDHHSAVARRFQRVRDAGRRCGASCPAEYPGAPGCCGCRIGLAASWRICPGQGGSGWCGMVFRPSRQTFQRAAFARYAGQSSEIEVPLPDGVITPALIIALFADEHEKTYGFRAPEGEPVELIGLSVMARGLPEQPRLPGRIDPFAQAVPRQPPCVVCRGGMGGYAGHGSRRADRHDGRAGDCSGVRRNLSGAEGHERPGG